VNSVCGSDFSLSRISLGEDNIQSRGKTSAYQASESFERILFVNDGDNVLENPPPDSPEGAERLYWRDVASGTVLLINPPVSATLEEVFRKGTSVQRYEEDRAKMQQAGFDAVLVAKPVNATDRASWRISPDGSTVALIQDIGIQLHANGNTKFVKTASRLQ